MVFKHKRQHENVNACDCIEQMPWIVPKLRRTATLFYFDCSLIVMSTRITDADQKRTPSLLSVVFLKLSNKQDRKLDMKYMGGYRGGGW